MKSFLNLIIFLFLAAGLSAQIVYVDGSSPTNGSGTSWGDPYNNLQTALQSYFPGQEIWVKAGTYYPDALNPGNQNESFDISGKYVYGGFNGTETFRFQRDWVNNTTILSGDIDGDGTSSGNSFHIITSSNSTWLVGFNPNERIQQGVFDGFTFTGGNSASDGLERGGAVYIDANRDHTIYGGDPTIIVKFELQFRNCTFENNHANWRGGACAIHQYKGSIVNCTFDNCVFQNNTAGNGGGAFGNLTFDPSSINTTSFLNCTFRNNNANSGGAMMNFGEVGANCSPQISNCTFINNTATDSGAAIWNSSYNGEIGLNASSTTFQSNTITANGWAGGAIRYTGGGTDSGSFSDCQFLNNGSATNLSYGGAIGFYIASNVANTTSFSNCTFDGNATKNAAGAIIFLGWNGGQTSCSFSSCTFQNNSSNTSGAIEWNGSNCSSSGQCSNVTPTFTDCLFDNNSANNGDGGAVRMFGAYGNISPVFQNCTFSNNHAQWKGGAAIIDTWKSNANPLFTDCQFTNNDATDGGGVFLAGWDKNDASHPVTSPQFTNCSFMGNSASQGSGLYVGAWNSSQWGLFQPIIERCYFNNSGGWNGGQNICVNADNGSASPTFSNCTIYSNYSLNASANYVYHRAFNGGDCSANYFNCTIYHSLSTGQRDLVKNDDASPSFTNCILWSYVDRSLINTGTSNPNVTYSLLNHTFIYPGTGNIGGDPLLIGTSPKLRYLSPAIDAGTNTGVASLDYYGKERTMNGQTDMGAYEFQLDQATTILPYGQEETANYEYTDNDGWTHYLKADYPTIGDHTLLFSVKKNGENIGTIGNNNFEAKAFGDYPGLDLSSADYVTNPNGWYVMNRYWQINNATQPLNPVKIRMYYEGQDWLDLKNQMNLSSIDQMYFYKITGNNIMPFDPCVLGCGGSYQEYAHGSSSSLSNWTDGYFLSFPFGEFEVSGFSGGGVGAANTGGGALPVKLLSFSVRQHDNALLLNWQTATETNNSGFEIQKSKDAKNWTKIGWQESFGNSITTQNYQFTDKTPFVGNNYYRLKQIDLDGASTYSKIVMAVFNRKGISFYPNPATKTITFNMKTVKTVDIYNIWGKKVLSREVASDLDISTLPSGVYVLDINRGEYRERLVVE